MAPATSHQMRHLNRLIDSINHPVIRSQFRTLVDRLWLSLTREQASIIIGKIRLYKETGIAPS